MNRKIQMIRLMLCRNGYRRAEYLKKKSYFHRQGEGCYFVPYNFGTEPHLLSFGNNVHVATGVRFINHDVTAMMFQRMECMKGKHLANRAGKIEIGDNVFIGAGSMILYDVKIGNNVIIGAGALVNKDIPDGGVYAGIPAAKIGEFDAYMKKTLAFSEKVNWNNEENRKSVVKKQKDYFWGSDRDIYTTGGEK